MGYTGAPSSMIAMCVGYWPGSLPTGRTEDINQLNIHGVCQNNYLILTETVPTPVATISFRMAYRVPDHRSRGCAVR